MLRFTPETTKRRKKKVARKERALILFARQNYEVQLLKRCLTWENKFFQYKGTTHLDPRDNLPLSIINTSSIHEVQIRNLQYKDYLLQLELYQTLKCHTEANNQDKEHTPKRARI